MEYGWPTLPSSKRNVRCTVCVCTQEALHRNASRPKLLSHQMHMVYVWVFRRNEWHRTLSPKTSRQEDGWVCVFGRVSCSEWNLRRCCRHTYKCLIYFGSSYYFLLHFIFASLISLHNIAFSKSLYIVCHRLAAAAKFRRRRREGGRERERDGGQAVSTSDETAEGSTKLTNESDEREYCATRYYKSHDKTKKII